MTAVAYETMEGKKPVTTVQPRPCSSSRWRCCLITYAVTITLVSGVTGFFLYQYMSQGKGPDHMSQRKGPEHAECSVTWSANAGCAELNQAIEDQIKEWNMEAECGPGRECLYQLTSNNGNYLDGNHTTPIRRFVDDFNFDFIVVGPGDCFIDGFSESQLDFAVLDGGANYCNVHNLMYGPNADALYTTIVETTNDDICTQYSIANCSMV